MAAIPRRERRRQARRYSSERRADPLITLRYIAGAAAKGVPMTMAADGTNPIVARAIRAARLEDAVYEEVARDPEATTQALLVVIATAILGAIGSITEGVGPLIGALIFAPAVWALGSALAFF